MSSTLTIVLIIVVLIIIAAIVYGVQVSRRKRLQSTFGPEYDRAVADTGSRSEAEKELRERERRHASFELKPLSAESQARYTAAWEEVQIQFVDDPKAAVATADELVTRLIAERGYPTDGDYDARVADLSVEHAGTLQHYRDAHEISQRSADGQASTEDLRQAMVNYRTLFAELVGTDPTPSLASSADADATDVPVAVDDRAPVDAENTPSGDVVDSTSDDGAAARTAETPAPRKPIDETAPTAPDTTR